MYVYAVYAFPIIAFNKLEINSCRWYFGISSSLISSNFNSKYLVWFLVRSQSLSFGYLVRTNPITFKGAEECVCSYLTLHFGKHPFWFGKLDFTYFCMTVHGSP